MYEIDTNSIKRAQEGDQYELERLIRENSGLIWSIVKRFQGRGYETEDLYQIGCMGFIKAIKRFDTNFEVKLSTYTVPYILGEIKRHLRDDGQIKISRSIKELAIKIRELQKEYLRKTGKEINIEQMTKELKVDKEDIIIALESSRPLESIDQSIGDGGDEKALSFLDKISTGKDEQEEITNHLAIEQLLSTLQTREKEIIMLRFYKEKTQAQVAKILGITQVQVSRLERKILEKMRGNLVGQKGASVGRWGLTLLAHLVTK